MNGLKEQDKNKHKGGRPKKAICRDAVLTVRMTETERMIIEKKAAAAGMTTGEWFRKAAHSGRVIPRFSTEEVSLIRNLAGACNNLNQMMKRAYTEGLLSIAASATELLKKISLIIDTLNRDDRQTD